MNRQIVYPGSIPQDTDLLLTNKHGMIGLGYLIQAVLGSSTLADGLACTPTSPATMTVNVAGGSIYSLAAIDATAYGSIAADTADLIMKQGIQIATQNFSCPAPSTSGQSVVYLIQAAYQDVDGGSTVLPYYNASNPAVPYSGPNNSGTPNFTVRQGKCILAVKTGVAAATGSQVTPTPDAGYVGLWAITVANGQTTITSGNIAAAAAAPFIGTKLTGKANTSSLGTLATLGVGYNLSIGGGLLVNGNKRMGLIANTTFYVATSGSNSNPGTSGSPFASLQFAIDNLLNNYDLNGYVATIQVADGTYTIGGTANHAFTGSGTVNITGNLTTPANCIISVTSSNCFLAQSGAVFNVGGFTVQTATAGACIAAQSGGQINITGPMVFGAAPTSTSHLYANQTGIINLQSNYTINNVSAGFHWWTETGGIITAPAAHTFTLTGTPSFTAFAQADNLGMLVIANASFSGSALGQRYNVSSNGLINTGGGGATFLPGSTSGASATGGLYA